MTQKQKTLCKRWLLGAGLALALILVSYGWLAYRTLQALGGMTNQTYQEVKSPDGRYVATLAYRDGMTFGFDYVCLQEAQSWQPLKPDDPLPHSEVVEAAAEGLKTISWNGDHTLVVAYEKSGDEAAQFVTQPLRWHDVKIVYRGTP